MVRLSWLAVLIAAYVAVIIYAFQIQGTQIGGRFTEVRVVIAILASLIAGITGYVLSQLALYVPNPKWRYEPPAVTWFRSHTRHWRLASGEQAIVAVGPDGEDVVLTSARFLLGWEQFVEEVCSALRVSRTSSAAPAGEGGAIAPKRRFRDFEALTAAFALMLIPFVDLMDFDQPFRDVELTVAALLVLTVCGTGAFLSTIAYRRSRMAAVSVASGSVP